MSDLEKLSYRVCKRATESLWKVLGPDNTVLAQGSADDETRFANRREYGVRIALMKERCAFARVSEQLDRIGVFICVSEACHEQKYGCQAKSAAADFHRVA